MQNSLRIYVIDLLGSPCIILIEINEVYLRLTSTQSISTVLLPLYCTREARAIFSFILCTAIAIPMHY